VALKKAMSSSGAKSGASLNPRVALERAGFVLLLMAVVMAALVLPFAISSLAASMKHPVAADAFHLAFPAKNQSSTTALNLRLVSIDETAQDVTVAVTGDRLCDSNCGEGQVVQFFSLRSDPRGSDGAPPSQDVQIPPEGEFDASVDLPVEGGLGSYPFDHYDMLLGLAVEDKSSSGQLVSVPARAARKQLEVSLDEQLPRFDLAIPKDVTGSYRFVGTQVALAARVDLSRPLYLQALTVFILVFIAIAGVYSVVTRAFKEVIATVGVVILGVWGVRTLLVGSYPPDSTAVDLILIFLILVLLMILTLRGLLLMWRRIGNHASWGETKEEVIGVHEPEEREEEEASLEPLSDIA
jgi:hypothetical protein